MTIKAPKNDVERLCWLQLIRTPGIGPITFWQLLSKYENAQNALSFLKENKTSSKRFPQPISQQECEQEIENHHKKKAELLFAGDSFFPEKFYQLYDVPPVISVMGQQKKWLNKHALFAIVGSRNCSLNGRKIAHQFAQKLGQENFKIISGLARGIDAFAHEASMNTGTIAVLGGGVDVIYPKENKKIYDAILEHGLILSEAPLSAQPQAKHFPRRNRLISILSKAVLVVEATPQSGSMITANLAAQQGIEVFAIPGSPLDPRAQGCNQLIQNGALLAQTPHDILDHFKIFTLEEKPPTYHQTIIPKDWHDNTDDVKTFLLKNLNFTAITIDEVVQQCHFSIDMILSALFELELEGNIVRLPGAKICLAS